MTTPDSHNRRLAIPRFLAHAGVVLATACLLALTGCVGGGGQRLYATLVPPGSVRMVQVTHVADRAEIVDSPVYPALIAAGIRDSDIRDGSTAIGRVFCCGGPSGGLERETRAFFYVPNDLQVGVLDFVEVRSEPQPSADAPHPLPNTAVRVREKSGDQRKLCRWLPDNPDLWKRVIYCAGMKEEGWVQQSGMADVWIKQ